MTSGAAAVRQLLLRRFPRCPNPSCRCTLLLLRHGSSGGSARAIHAGARKQVRFPEAQRMIDVEAERRELVLSTWVSITLAKYGLAATEAYGWDGLRALRRPPKPRQVPVQGPHF